MIITVTPNPCMDKTLSVARFEIDKTNRATLLATELGGKGINVAAAAAVLGTDVLCTGFDFSENSPSFLEKQLSARAIPQDFLRVAGELRCCTKIFDESRRSTVEVNERGSAVTPADADALIAHVTALAKNASFVVLSGSLPAGLSKSFYATCVRALRKAAPDTRVVVDAEGEALLLALEEKPFLIKPNANEFCGAFGAEPTLAEVDCVANELIAAGRVQTVCVSMGGEGAYLANAAGAWFAPPAKIAVKSLTGAGDAMVAGLCTAFEKGLSLDCVLAYGVASSATAIRHEGTAFGTREEFEAILPTVKLQKMHEI